MSGSSKRLFTMACFGISSDELLDSAIIVTVVVSSDLTQFDHAMKNRKSNITYLFHII